MEHVPLPHGERLALELGRPPRPDRPWVVFLHGLAANRSGDKALYLHEELCCRGYGFARFDFRGHGQSDGNFSRLTLTRQLEDLACVLRWLSSEEQARQPILVGSSLGGLTAAWHCARNPSSVSAQVLIAPAFRIVERTLESIGPRRAEEWRIRRRLRFPGERAPFELDYTVVEENAFLPYSALCEATVVPTWLVHGSEDEVVPLQESVRFAARCPTPTPVLRVFHGGDHRLSQHRDQLLDVVLECLGSCAHPRQEPVLS